MSECFKCKGSVDERHACDTICTNFFLYTKKISQTPCEYGSDCHMIHPYMSDDIIGHHFETNSGFIMKIKELKKTKIVADQIYVKRDGVFTQLPPREMLCNFEDIAFFVNARLFSEKKQESFVKCLNCPRSIKSPNSCDVVCRYFFWSKFCRTHAYCKFGEKCHMLHLEDYDDLIGRYFVGADKNFYQILCFDKLEWKFNVDILKVVDSGNGSMFLNRQTNPVYPRFVNNFMKSRPEIDSDSYLDFIP